MSALIEELRSLGMKVGNNVAIYNCIFDTNFPFLIEIGNDTIVTHATVLAHDASPTVAGLGVVAGRVRIGHRCFVGAGACILPGVTIGDDSIVGANSVITKDVASGSVVAGNPARVVCSTAEWRARLLRMKEGVNGQKRELISVQFDVLVPSEAQSKELAVNVRQRFGI
jgi:maltose O-acetyltransferase